jgi:hypothetical protein
MEGGTAAPPDGAFSFEVKIREGLSTEFLQTKGAISTSTHALTLRMNMVKTLTLLCAAVTQ